MKYRGNVLLWPKSDKCKKAWSSSTCLLYDPSLGSVNAEIIPAHTQSLNTSIFRASPLLVRARICRRLWTLGHRFQESIPNEKLIWTWTWDMGTSISTYFLIDSRIDFSPLNTTTNTSSESRHGARSRFQEPSLELSSQATWTGGPVR